eukprot:TRINITY_DN2498_c0_g1_i3.p1 TRINITY_DN2498_c0_g1~~TRINITY_DN2498_c0_g1_i3.p1  ORF type:complete len:154 (+),score=23.26 TRINITY_DN2498_c0_g1_i3:25-462(+)
MDDYHAIANSMQSRSDGPNKWQYEIQPNKLQKLLSKIKNKEKPAELLCLLRMELLASAATNRIIDAWQCQVSYMPFPSYSDEDIVNICGAFQATKQPELWLSVRNVILDAVSHLVDGGKCLAEMMRYRLRENADIIFEYTLWPLV